MRHNPPPNTHTTHNKMLSHQNIKRVHLVYLKLVFPSYQEYPINNDTTDPLKVVMQSHLPNKKAKKHPKASPSHLLLSTLLTAFKEPDWLSQKWYSGEQVESCAT